MTSTSITSHTLNALGDISLTDFFSFYWQKKPLFIANAFENFETLISAEELAGFSLDHDVNSRLIIENPQTASWQVKHGPLSKEDFDALPESHWSLLVQNVDTLDPRVNTLLQQFRFLPNWQLDDIMISYSPTGGSVGPHFDYYDVFLLQAEGERLWKIGQHCDSHSALVPDQPMKILENFQCEAEWVSKPGDLIYIPANIAHWGVSLKASQTYSIGFRAPSHAELMLDLSQTLASTMNEDERCKSDASTRDIGDDMGRIDTSVIASIQSSLLEKMHQPLALAQSLGEFSTRLTHDIDLASLPLEYATREDAEAHNSLQLSNYCRCAYAQINNKTLLFLNGATYESSAGFAATLSNTRIFCVRDLPNSDKQLALELIDAGVFIIKDNSNHE